MRGESPIRGRYILVKIILPSESKGSLFQQEFLSVRKFAPGNCRS